MDKLKGHPVGLFVDLQKILSSLNDSTFLKDADAKTIMDESVKTWKNVYYMSGGTDGDAMTATSEINFVDQSTNSLKTIKSIF